MQVKLFEIKGIEDGLKKIADTDLNVKVAYKIAKVLKKIAEESGTIEETRAKLVSKYGTHIQKDGQPVCEVDEDKKQDFFKEYGDLLNEEIELDIKPLSLSDLGDIKLSPVDMIKLEKIVKEEKCCGEKGKCEKKEVVAEPEEAVAELEPEAPKVEDVVEPAAPEVEDKK